MPELAVVTSDVSDDIPDEVSDWLIRLVTRLDHRAKTVELSRNYYEGRHNLAFATDKFRQAFGGLFKEFADNWCGVVVQAPSERMRIRGISFPNEQGEMAADRQAWAMWQRNDLDAWASVHHTETLATGYGYALVWPDSEGRAQITVEDSGQCIVAYAPGSHTMRAASLKTWIDEWDEHRIAYLYLPDAIYKFRSEKPFKAGSRIRWAPWKPNENEMWPLPNPLRVVPMVEFRNDPTLRGNQARSEIQRVIPLQNGVNKLMMDMHIASEFSAFRQRYVIGWTPEEEGGNATPEEIEAMKLRGAVSRMLTFENSEVKLGEFSETNLKNYVEAIEMTVHHIAAQTRTPRHYFFQSGQSPSGDAIKSAETGLVAKVQERMLHYGENWEEVFRLGFAVESDPRQKATDAELIWGDPEYRTEGELTDAVIKQKQAGLVTTRKAQQRLGYSPQEIDEMQGDLMQENLIAQGSNLNTLLQEPTPE